MTIILAKILGIYLLGIGIAFLLNPDRFRKILQATKDETYLFFGAILAILIGATIVTLHNVWVVGWPVIITILGWWSLFKGFALLVYPNFIHVFPFLQNKSDRFYRFVSLIYLVLGFILIYMSYKP